MLGYDWSRWHALLNDFPAALLPVAVAFEAASLVTKRETWRQVSFWTLITGTVGTGIAVLAGLQAEEAIEHGDAIHEVMETHETFAYITLGVFAVVTLWRSWREKKMGGAERMAALALALGGMGALVATGREGGELVFDHAAGISTSVMQKEIENRTGEHEHAPGEMSHQDEHAPTAPAAADSAAAPTAPATKTAPTKAPHTHKPGTPAHTD